MVKLIPTQAVAAVSFGSLVRHLGGVGLVLLGVLNSVAPLPGSVDALTIVLAARHKELWAYYALMATVGSVIGGYITYQIARSGGKETLSRRLRPERAASLFRQFGRWAFGTVLVSSLLPPPFPVIPIFVVAGAMQYSRKKFLISLTLGRIARYFAIALAAAVYGHRLFSYLEQSHTTLILVCAGTVLILVLGVLWLRRYLAFGPSKTA